MFKLEHDDTDNYDYNEELVVMNKKKYWMKEYQSLVLYLRNEN